MSKPIFSLNPLYDRLVQEDGLRTHIRASIAHELGHTCNKEFHDSFNYVTDFIALEPESYGIDTLVGEDYAKEIIKHFYLFMTPSSIQAWADSPQFKHGATGLAHIIFYSLPPLLKHPFCNDIAQKDSVYLQSFILITTDILAFWERVLGGNFGSKTGGKNTPKTV